MAGDSQDRRYLLAIDIGGTKVAAGVVTLLGEQVSAERILTLAAEGPEPVIGRIIEVGRRAVEAAGVPWSQVIAVGAGCAGPLDPATGTVINPPNLPGWIRVPLADRLGEAFDRPVFLENDANAAALGELRFGAGRGVANMVYMTISTGIGGGIIVDNRLYRGQNGNAGELGHVSVAYNGRRCSCGNVGCLEAYASGTNIAARAREAIAAGEASALPALAGSVGQITAETVVEGVRQGDALARRIWDESIEILGAGISNVIHAFNPGRVVLGGGLTSAGDLLFEPLRKAVFGRVLKALAGVVEIVPAQLGEQVGVLGAAAVVLDRLP